MITHILLIIIACAVMLELKKFYKAMWNVIHWIFLNRERPKANDVKRTLAFIAGVVAFIYVLQQPLQDISALIPIVIICALLGLVLKFLLPLFFDN